MKVGNCGPHPSSCGPSQAKGGSGEKFKAKGGSGEHAPPGLDKKGGMPPGLAKKFGDGFDGQNGTSQGEMSQRSGGGLLGSIFGQGGWLSNLFGGWGNNNNNDVMNYQGSTPQTVTQKNATPTLPVLDPANAPPKNVAAKALPGISQMDPTGKDANYTNAAMNCGPTVLAMIGDAYGKKPVGMSDADYINSLGAKAGTTGTGTTGNGMIAALNDMGFETAANKGADLSWINNQLAQGHEVIANGDFYSLAAHPSDTQVAGHYVGVTAYQDGLYTVNDPANGQITKLTPQQLADFIAHHPEGGFTLATWPDPTVG